MMMQHRNWFNALKTLVIVAFVFLVNTKCLACAEEISNSSEENNLQIQEPDETAMAKRAWKELQGSWGKRNYDEDIQKLLQNEEYLDEPQFRTVNVISEDSEIPSPAVEKRAWQSMNNAWGKRASRQFRGVGSWKREPGNWGNLRGLWGKRSTNPQWSKLSSAWGRKK
jgi:hypothetical protein